MTGTDTSDSADFIKALKTVSAEQILQFGSVDENLIAAILSQANWSNRLQLHCVASADLTESAAFDKRMSDIEVDSSVEIDLTKHLGSATDVNDEVLSISEVTPFDAIFISGASSPEELLTGFMVSNESLKPGGVLGVSKTLIQNETMATAISSFLEMYRDCYDEPGGHLLIKK